MRLFFATDIHGSETCWRKFLNSASHYSADVVVLGGDMTGKALVPVSATVAATGTGHSKSNDVTSRARTRYRSLSRT